MKTINKKYIENSFSELANNFNILSREFTAFGNKDPKRGQVLDELIAALGG